MSDNFENGMVDNVGSNEVGSFETTTERGFEEHQVIHGFVTVVKNLGREDEEILCENKHNLLTTVGRDAMHDALYVDVTPVQQGFNNIALSVNASGADASHTEVAGEITGNGLARIVASIHTHVPTQNTSTVAHTFTAVGGAHTAVQLAGLFDVATAPVSGILGHENTFTPASLQINDTLTVTWTLTLG